MVSAAFQDSALCSMAAQARRWLAILAVGVAAACAAPSAPAPVRDPAVTELLDALATAPDAASALVIEQEIWAHWATSGSPTVDVLLERAAAAENAGDPELAHDFLVEAGELAPQMAEVWNRRAALAFEAQDYAGALRAIEETLRREPQHFGALAGLGAIYEALGERRAALAAYREALQIHPYLEAARQGVARLSVTLDGRDA
jgi:tetratricopeptide (TPR) repeat protein